VLVLRCLECSLTCPRYPVNSVQPDAVLETHLRSVFTKYLQSAGRQSKVVLCESIATSMPARDQMARVLFDRLGVQSVLWVPSALSALYATGQLTAWVIEVGHLETACVPVVDGVVLTHATQMLPIGSATIHAALRAIIAEGEHAKVSGSSTHAHSGVQHVHSAATLSHLDLEDALVRGCFVREIGPVETSCEGVNPIDIVLVRRF
jgi:actin-related protein